MMQLKKAGTLIMLLPLLIACEVHYNLTGGSVPAEARTVSVSFFVNNAPLANPNLSQSFTEALKDVFISQTKLNLVQTMGDLQFSGSIAGYDIRPVAIQGDETAALNRLTITIQVKYINTFDEKQNFDQSFTRFVDFPSTTDLSSNEESLISEVNKQLVQDIYDRAFGNW